MAGMKRTLAVDLAGLGLPTPVVIASGCGGTGREVGGLVDPRKVGGIVSRTITVDPRKGSPAPRVAETPSGIVWETGLQNPGLDAFCEQELPRLVRGGSVVFVSIGGRSVEEFVRLTSVLQDRPEVAAIEVHLSEPDDELGREVIGTHADRVTEIVGACARMSRLPVFAKLPHAPALVVELAVAAVRAGAHGLTLMDSPPALAVDPARLRAMLGPVSGRLAGPALRPLTLRSVYDVARTLPDVPIMASGGVRTGEDAMELLLAGAWAVQVGTAMLVDPAAPIAVARGIARYLKDKDLGSPADVRGRLGVTGAAPSPAEASS